jgi:hypothetical protein
MTQSIDTFLFYPIYSDVGDNPNSIAFKNLIDKNDRFKNIFELRKSKNNYLLNVMKNSVKNYISIRYEDLLFNYEYILNVIKTTYGLVQKHKHFKNVEYYKKEKMKPFEHKTNGFSSELKDNILFYLDAKQEARFGYDVMKFDSEDLYEVCKVSNLVNLGKIIDPPVHRINKLRILKSNKKSSKEVVNDIVKEVVIKSTVPDKPEISLLPEDIDLLSGMSCNNKTNANNDIPDLDIYDNISISTLNKPQYHLQSNIQKKPLVQQKPKINKFISKIINEKDALPIYREPQPILKLKNNINPPVILNLQHTDFVRRPPLVQSSEMKDLSMPKGVFIKPSVNTKTNALSFNYGIGKHK